MVTCTTITINIKIDFLGTISDLYAHTYELKFESKLSNY